ncbi:unnamed protein product [Calypogeia fissa]
MAPRKRSPSVSSISSAKSDGYSSQSGASLATTQDSRKSFASDATGYYSDYDDSSSSKKKIASMAKTTAGLTRLVQSSIAKLKKKGGCPVKTIREDIKDSHGYTLTGAHNTRRLNTVLKKLQKDGKIMKTAKGYKLVPASELRRRRHHHHKGRRRRRRRRGGKRRRRRRHRRHKGRKHRRRRRWRRRHGKKHHRKGRKGHRRRRRRRRHGRKHATQGSSKTAKLRRGVAKLSLKGNSRPLPGGPVKGGGAGGPIPEGTSPPSKTASRLPSGTASRRASRNPSPARPRLPYQRVCKRAKVSELAEDDDDYDE